MNIPLHTLSIEQHTSANHNGLLSRHGWGFVLNCERAGVCLKRELSIKLKAERKCTFDQDFIRDLLQAFLKHHPLFFFFFLRRTAANYTTAILNAHPESSNQNKAKACSTCVTLNWGGSPASSPPKHTSPCSRAQGASPSSPDCSSVPEQLQSSIRTEMGLDPFHLTSQYQQKQAPHVEPHGPHTPYG